MINWQQWQNKKIGSKPSGINVFKVFCIDSIFGTKKDLFCVIISLQTKLQQNGGLFAYLNVFLFYARIILCIQKKIKILFLSILMKMEF